MNAQEIFDTSWTKITAQGQPATSRVGGGAYRQGDLACGVGVLIDAATAAAFDACDNPDIGAILADTDLAPDWMHEHGALLTALQHCHDKAARNVTPTHPSVRPEPFIAGFQRRMLKVADRFNLKVPQ